VSARTLLAHDLIDEMRLMTDPIVVGRGKRLFPDVATEPDTRPTGFRRG
jgi:dihydrofolate reductase